MLVLPMGLALWSYAVHPAEPEPVQGLSQEWTWRAGEPVGQGREGGREAGVKGQQQNRGAQRRKRQGGFSQPASICGVPTEFPVGTPLGEARGAEGQALPAGDGELFCETHRPGRSRTRTSRAMWWSASPSHHLLPRQLPEPGAGRAALPAACGPLRAEADSLTSESRRPGEVNKERVGDWREAWMHGGRDE